MTRSISRWPALVVAAAICGLLATGCDGDDEANRSTAPGDSQEVVDGGGDEGDGDGGDPFKEECTLATQEVKNLLDPPDDYVEWEVTSESDWAGCEWSNDGYSMALLVNVKAYDDYYHDESTGKSIPGLGDESWFNTQVSSLYWRRDGYSVSLQTGITEHFTQRRLIDLAHAIDSDLPAA